ncbi:MAG TPA: hypothetical protein PKN18_10940, partial [Pseudomonadales bacterium]|nr:hypothetical protein [Pseudomonadales bacterium]
SAGFNALLKLVEEPPEHVKFVFATTEPDKVIGTIRSRTHHYPFRLIPPQHCPNQFLVDYIARHSYRQSSEGWQLKSDAKLLGRFEREDQTDALLALRCRFGVIHGGLSSTFRAEQRDYLAYVAPPGSPFVELPGANHHLFIDQPLEFAAQLKTLLAQW